MMDHATPLKRSMGLVGLTLYGIGDMLGSGIYALMGKYAGAMGNAVWMAFLCSSVAAMLTGLTYASLGSRYPKAAGAAYVTHRTFGLPMLSYVLGLSVMASGLTSMGTATHGVTRYARELLDIPQSSTWFTIATYAIMVGFILLVTVINFRGIQESTWANIICTLVEVGGLAIIVLVGLRYWGGVNYLQTPIDPATGLAKSLSPTFMLSGAVLTFYSFVGFEDMLNVSEEVKNPRKIFPLGIILAVVFTTLIYIAVSITAVSVLGYEKLSASAEPMVDVMRVAAPWFPPILFTAISIFAISNTALLNYIMGSRLVYGMARQGLLPAVLGKVHAKRQTPHVAILTLMVIVLILIFQGNISELASATSLLLLMVFTIINIAWIILRKRPGEPQGAFEVHWLIPLGGAIVCSTLVTIRVIEAFQNVPEAKRSVLIAVEIIAAICILYLIHRPKATPEAVQDASADE